jgi:hypothetical protein
MQWLQDPNQTNLDKINTVKLSLKNLKTKIDELETNSKIKNIRDLNGDISDFKKGYRPRDLTVKDEKCDLVTIPTLLWLGGGNISLSY